MRIITWCLVVSVFVQFESYFSLHSFDFQDKSVARNETNLQESSTTLPRPIFNGKCDLSDCSSSNLDLPRKFTHCSCDKECIEFRDCCTDSQYYKREEQQKSMNYECHQIGNLGYFLKRSCPSSWDDVEISSKCAMSSKHNLDTEEIELRLPVTSTATNITYGNIYCALCNNEWDDVTLWNVSIGNCSVISKKKLNESYKNLTKYMDTITPKIPIRLSFDNLTFDGKYWFYEDENTRYNCLLTLKQPSSLQLHSCPLENTSMIRDCLENWTDTNTADQCRSIHSKVYDRYETPYRNKYCAYCNGLNDVNLNCGSEIKYTKTTRKHQTSNHEHQFTVLFDFKLKSDSKICKDKKKSYQNIQKNLCPRGLSTLELEANENVPADNKSWFQSILSIYTFVAILISIIFLLLHLTIFFVVQELQTIAGKNLASFCIALILAYGSFLFSYFAQNQVCYATSVVMYYSFLCAFFWMLIISYDMWNTFRNATKKFRSPKNVKKTFVIYSILVWSLPLILIGTTLYFDLVASKSVLAPHFGYNGCWFDNGFSLLLFFVSPVCVILIVNFALFLHTWYLLHSSRCESVNQKSRVDFKLFTRIGLLTGFTWITGFFAGYTQILIIWFIFVVLNTAQGVFIFSAFSCKKRVIRSFLKRINKFEKWQRYFEETNVISNGTTSIQLSDSITRNS